jgi:hypothetical protein
LSSAVSTIFFYTQGLTNFLQQLTIFVFKIFDATLLAGLTGGDVLPVGNNNKVIFEKAFDRLGVSNVLLSSTIVAAQRADNGTGVVLTDQTPTGNMTIKASKLIISILPLLDKHEAI